MPALRVACTPNSTLYTHQQLGVALQDNMTQPPTAYGGPFNVLNQPSDSGTTHMSIVDGKARSASSDLFQDLSFGCNGSIALCNFKRVL